MTSEEIRSLIKQAKDSWIKGDSAAFARLFTLDGEFIVPGQRWVGRAAIQQVAAEFASGHAVESIEIQSILIEANHAAIEWTWQDRALDGARHTAHDAILIDFKGGLISRWREYIDTESPQTI